MMGFAFGLTYIGLCGLVLGGIALVWAVLILVGSWRLKRQQRRLSDDPKGEPSRNDHETPLEEANEDPHEHNLT